MVRGETPPPKTGTSLPFIWPPPDHFQTPPPFEEPVLPSPPSESLLARETALDALRCEEPIKYQGQQVYDSLTKPSRDDYPDPRGATADEDMPRWYVPSGPDDDTVVFESRFESGNLRSAVRIDVSEYNLQLAYDINTDRHTQWFYFRMSNLRQGRPYKLNMQNMMKTEAVYNLGMQPLAYSQTRAEEEGIGWYRTGSDACYFKNQLTRAGLKPFWTLTFVVETMYDGDTLYLAHCFPYRYTDLQQYLNELEASPLAASCAIRRRTLCETLAGNACDLLTITSPRGDHASKKGIVISARVHPGESNASWMMKGVLDYLTSDCHCAIALRDKFVFKIVPMLNPDGVIVGNYRCSLAGSDLNRQYEEPERELFPEVLNLKQTIANLAIGKEVMLFVDLHGHSKKSNIFMYGVENPTDEALYMRERVVPTLLERASPIFNLADCTFDIGKGKEGCGRVVVRRQLGIVNAFTMEASFMGADQGEFQGIHFHQGHFEAMGHSLCEVLLDLVDSDQSKVEGIVQELRRKFPINQSRVISKPHDGGGDSDGSGDSSDDSESSSARRERHFRRQRAVAKAPSKPSTPTSRPLSRPGSRAGKSKKTGQQSGKGAALDGASRGGSGGGGGGGNHDESKQKTLKNTGSKSILLVASKSLPPAAAAGASAEAPPRRIMTAINSVGRDSAAAVTTPSRPSTPRSIHPKSGGPRKEGFTGGKASGGGGGSGVGGGAKQKGKEKVGQGAPLKGRTASESTPTCSSPGVSVKTATRVGSAKALADGGSPATAGGGGGASASHLKVTVGPSTPTSGSAATTAGNKMPKKSGGGRGGTGVKAKAKATGIPPSCAPGAPRRPKSSPASRSVSSPRRQTTTAAASGARRRPPSAPSKTDSRRPETSSRSASARKSGVGPAMGSGSKGAKGGGESPAAGGRGKKEVVLPLPPLRSNLISSEKKERAKAANGSAGK